MMPFFALHCEENSSCVRLGSSVDDEFVGLSEARFEQVVAGCGVSSFTSGALLLLEQAVAKTKRPPSAAVSSAWLADKSEDSAEAISKKPSTFYFRRNCTTHFIRTATTCPARAAGEKRY